MLIPSWNVVEQFERRMAAYAGAPFAIATDTCTSALALCFSKVQARVVSLPPFTYLGVACAAIHAGAEVRLNGDHWKGAYKIVIDGKRDWWTIWDGACRMRRDMYRVEYAGSTVCLSFQSRKHLKIGRGGMILTDDAEHAAWFRKARFLGRAEHNGVPEFIGWHCFMEPERAARGLQLMDSLPDDNKDLCFKYPDLRQYEVLRGQK